MIVKISWKNIEILESLRLLRGKLSNVANLVYFQGFLDLIWAIK